MSDYDHAIAEHVKRFGRLFRGGPEEHLCEGAPGRCWAGAVVEDEGRMLCFDCAGMGCGGEEMMPLEAD